MTTPAERARILCDQRNGNFREEVEAFMVTGFVFSGPRWFLMGKAVPRSADLSDLWAPYAPDECDAWWVWCGVGDAATLLSLMPYPLEWVGWHRQGRNWQGRRHWLSTAELRARLGNTLSRSVV